MPIYEYECPDCKTQIEILLKGFDEIKPLCKHCLAQNKKQIEMKRIISKTNFQLRGNGWYKDHYGLKKNDEK